MDIHCNSAHIFCRGCDALGRRLTVASGGASALVNPWLWGNASQGVGRSFARARLALGPVPVLGMDYFRLRLYAKVKAGTVRVEG